MPPLERPALRTTAIGLRACKGGATLVAVVLEDGEPRVVQSTLLASSEAGDRLSLEPYRIASDMPRGPEGRATAEAAETVAQGRRRQAELATRSLGDIIGQLKDQGFAPIIVVLLVNRAGWISDLLDYSLAWREHVPVAELLAVRDALRAATRQCELDRVDVDEKSLEALASSVLGLPPATLAVQLKTLGASRWKPWRKEEKSACLAAWVALARPGIAHH